MKIHNDHIDGAGGAAQVPRARDTQAAAKAQQDGAVRPAGEDSVQTSALVRAVAGDSEKVERLRQAVQDGTYFVSAGDIASKLIGEHIAGGEDAERR